MRISVSNAQLATGFVEALAAAGHELVPSGGELLLIDHDLPDGYYGPLCDAHARVVVYPHGGGVVASGDGQWPVHPHTVLRLEHGPGQVEVLRRSRYPRRAEVIGWNVCSRRPFTPRPLRRVVLAPQHALGNGWFPPELRAQNAHVHDLLAAMAIRGTIHLTVRTVGPFEPLGLVKCPVVLYEQGYASLTHALLTIDRADCVVGSYGTFPVLAVARGVPTVFYGQIPLDDDYGLEDRHPAKSWARYKDYVRFPLDATETDDLPALLARACLTDVDIAEWRDRFIGPAFDPARFAKLVEACASA